jgi:hypothetical protein
MKQKKVQKNNFIRNTIIIILIIIIVYYTIYYLFSKSIKYDDPIHIQNIFTSEEIEIMQSCVGNSTEINKPCYKKLHSKIVNSLKKYLGVEYLYIDHARFSNNSNGDGQTYHKDVKPKPFYNNNYPNVYTIILYLDPAGIYIGNKKVIVSPGDIVIFNAFYLHKAIGIKPLSSTHQRRVLQLFNCFFDENEKNNFYKRNSKCGYTESRNLATYLSYFIDLRMFVEYMNLTSLIPKKCPEGKDNSDFYVFINEKYYLTTIDNVRYYSIT